MTLNRPWVTKVLPRRYEHVVYVSPDTLAILEEAGVVEETTKWVAR